MGTRFRDLPEEVRKREYERISRRYKDRIPIIVEKAQGCRLPDIDKQKFLAPSTINIAQFMYIIRKRIRLSPEEALFIFTDNKLVANSMMLSRAHRDHKADDGFLYLTYQAENCFGSQFYR